MAHGLVIANVDRAGGHIVIVGVLVVVAAVGGMIYGLVRLVGKNRAARTRSDHGADGVQGPEATRSNRGPEA